MRCKHMHRDDPENAICEDCYTTDEAELAFSEQGRRDP